MTTRNQTRIRLIRLITLISVVTTASIHAASVSDYNIVWDSPSADYNGSMPIGNGDIGANVWAEDGGDLLFYISKTDSWSENGRLLKLGKVRIRLTPNPFVKGCTFKQELDLKNGVIKITSSTKSPETSVDLRFWVDTNNPVIRITGSTSAETNVEVMLEHWRTERTKASWDWSFSGLQDRTLENGGFPYPVFIEPDTVLDRKNNSIVWYHRNKKSKHSVWEDTLKVQGLEDFIDKSSDPLLNLTFVALVQGDGMVSKSPTVQKSTEPMKSINLFVFPLTAQASTPNEWVQKVEAQAVKYKRKSPESVWDAHKKWWNQFWDRSWIYIDSEPGDDAFIVARGYTLQNWITACGGRRNMPIKFNGSIFTVDGLYRDRNMGPDYRRWGSAYWWQNTRLPYWPMLAAGNYGMMKPLFKMYTDAMLLAQHRMQNITILIAPIFRKPCISGALTGMRITGGIPRKTKSQMK